MTEHPYKYELRIYWSAEDQAFLAEVPDLPGCVAHGDTPADAARHAEEAIVGWVEMTRDLGMEVPAPTRSRVAG